MRYFTIFFSTKPSKSGVYFIFRAHLSLDEHFSSAQYPHVASVLYSAESAKHSVLYNSPSVTFHEGCFEYLFFSIALAVHGCLALLLIMGNLKPYCAFLKLTEHLGLSLVFLDT